MKITKKKLTGKKVSPVKKTVKKKKSRSSISSSFEKELKNFKFSKYSIPSLYNEIMRRDRQSELDLW